MKRKNKQDYSLFIRSLDSSPQPSLEVKDLPPFVNTLESILNRIDKEWPKIGYFHESSVIVDDLNPPNSPNSSLFYDKNDNSSIWVRTPIVPKTRIDNSNEEIQDLKSLIHFIDRYPADNTKEYVVPMERFYKIHTSLIDLDNMIGMKEVKENIVDQVLYFIQDLHKHDINSDKKESVTIDFMHTVIYGPPGTGKTEIAKIIGQIFCKLGILKKGTFRKATRSDLIAGYLGQSAIKTRDVIQDCLGGVLFIDEAYSLGSTDRKDSFSKECIDTLCEALSHYKEELMVIIAGYETELKQCFFKQNQGLESRFTWRFKTDNYKADELYQIFLKKVKDCNWTIDPLSEANISSKWFDKNKDYFTFFGRDMETLLAKIKISHGRRVFCKPIEEKKKITFIDLEKGFEYYLRNDEVKNRKERGNFYHSMFV